MYPGEKITYKSKTGNGKSPADTFSEIGVNSKIAITDSRVSTSTLAARAVN